MLAPARLDWSRGASTGDLARWRLTRALSRGKPRPRRGGQVSGDAAKKVESSEERGTIKVPGKLVGKRSSAGHSSLLGDKPIRADKFGSPSLHFFSKAYVKSRKRQLSFFNASLLSLITLKNVERGRISLPQASAERVGPGNSCPSATKTALESLDPA
ncbi:MAG: hypothetical protein A3A30_00235 [Candidatus Terrybacteria bacterium RIFCSPLOWO2_01_FULL_48_14]|nr:MAG: hypothetical protein A3A30_00235 [Candidatus Terrybacteria bacterium RIFCSPLOWO2_01_FULL_48_14]